MPNLNLNNGLFRPNGSRLVSLKTRPLSGVDKRHWQLIVPCGIADKGVTSLSVALGQSVDVSTVVPQVARHFGDVFGVEMRQQQTEDVLA